MQPHQQRVVTELKDLSDKREKLGAFLQGDVFKSLDLAERGRLVHQYEIMGKYADILRERIADFKEEKRNV
jgi:crAss001_48 related protein